MEGMENNDHHKNGVEGWKGTCTYAAQCPLLWKSHDRSCSSFDVVSQRASALSLCVGGGLGEPISSWCLREMEVGGRCRVFGGT